MTAPFPKFVYVLPVLVVCFGSRVQQSKAQVNSLQPPPNSQTKQTRIEDSWIVENSEAEGLEIHTRELTLYPMAEPRPALKYRLIGDDYELLDGNAAIFYLKAMGFIEQNSARERLTELRKQLSVRAQAEGRLHSEWRFVAPSELPLDEVKDYLQLTSFQPALLREAARRDRFDMDRNLREVEDPLGYSLPEIPAMRELGRTQNLRCRLAMAEGRTEDAIEIIGQQYAMARHLGQDEFLVSNLVGMAIASIAWNDVLYLVQRPNTPNLYWAFTAMPTPLVDIRHSLAIERQLLYEQLKALREVDETARPVGYWQDFLDRPLPQIGYFQPDIGLPSFEDDPQLARAALVGYVAAAYPGAKDYLIHECKLSPEQVDAYPTAQVVFLAIVRFYDQWRDEYFKWTHLPFWQAQSKTERGLVDNAMRAASERYGLCSAPANLLLPAVPSIHRAEARCEQAIAMTQTVEAIRMYGAAHDGELPRSLDDLSVPAPIEPFTGKPIDYRFHGDHAVISGHPIAGLRYRFVVRFAEAAE